MRAWPNYVLLLLSSSAGLSLQCHVLVLLRNGVLYRNATPLLLILFLREVKWPQRKSFRSICGLLSQNCQSFNNFHSFYVSGWCRWLPSNKWTWKFSWSYITQHRPSAVYRFSFGNHVLSQFQGLITIRVWCCRVKVQVHIFSNIICWVTFSQQLITTEAKAPKHGWVTQETR